MNFGDILDKWERKKSKEQRNSDMETWLNANSTYDKDAGSENEKIDHAEKRRRLKSKKPDDVLDIHGLTREEAWLSLDSFFARARDSGFEKLRVIHGKGNHSEGESVLGRTVRDFIEQCPNAGESGHEKAAAGGTGATWVLMKD